VLPELRATQVEQSFLMSPAQTLYFRTNFDLTGTSIPESFVQVNALSAARFLVRSEAEVLELPEPLWVRFLPINFGLAIAWRLSGFARLRNRRARTYAIENNDPTVVIFGRKIPPRTVAWLGLVAVGLVFRFLYERVAFGTQGAANAYGRLPFARGVPSAVIPALPSASAQASAARSNAVVFVGHLDTRKGVRRLLNCWPRIESISPEAVLTIIGDGPLRDEVQAWTDLRPHTRRYLGSLPHSDSVATISGAQVLVAPSVRDGRWREQVGLPIVEGLACGLTIVTSDDTGLSDWLRSNGHFVYSNSDGDEALTRAVTNAIKNPIDQQVVFDSLPSHNGRIEADNWLHNG
jgi:glycosyltransferase involved in cell wall biosynthesis